MAEGEENDLDALTALLDDDDEEWTTSEDPMAKDEDVTRKVTPVAEEDEEEEALTSADLGLELSEDEASVDPLEAELRLMEERMKDLRQRLKTKKRLGPGEASFSKLTTVDDGGRRKMATVSSRPLDDLPLPPPRREEPQDSEDEEDERNPFEPRYNECGRDVRRISRESAAQRDEKRRDEVLARVKAKDTRGWSKVNGSLVSLKGGPSMSNNGFEKNCSVDQFSGIRLVNPLVSGDAMRERMEGRKMVRMSTINLHLRGGDVEGDWVTIGVLVSKSEPKTSQKGSQYSIWKLSDLTDCTKTVALFLFSGAHKGLWKSSVGTVVGILNPQIMKDRHGDKTQDLLTLSIFDQHKVMVIGSSKDLGWCKGRTKQNSQCRSFVNKSTCEFCVYHIQREYRKTSSKRADIQSSFTSVEPRRRLQEKVLGKDQVFYGGQLYTSPSPISVPKPSRAHGAKDLATLNSLKLKLKTEQLKAEDKERSFALKHMTHGEIDAIKQLSKRSDDLCERLMAPTPGARNLLRHMTREDESRKAAETGEVRSVSARDLLKMTHQQAQNRKRLQNQTLDSPSPEGRPAAPFSLTAIPQLGRGSRPGADVNLDLSPSLARPDPVKARAVALLKRKGGIEAKDPNAIKSAKRASDPGFQEKVRRRIDSAVDSESEDPAMKKARLTEAMLGDQPGARLSPIDINSDQFKAMMEQKSRHTNLVDAVENEAFEKYCQALEKKEMLEDKMAAIMEVPTNAYVCVKCKYMAESASDLCREEGHPLKTVKAKKRFFECRNCKRRTSSLDKLPKKECGNCHEGSWKRVAMGKVKKGPMLDSEVLSLRGDELKHYSGNGSNVYLHI